MKSIVNTKGKSRSEIITSRLFECIHNGEVENIQLKKIWLHVGDVLGIKTPKMYADEYNITPQGAHKKNKEKHFGTYFIIDNE